MTKYIVTNSEQTKGILLEAESATAAKKEATDLFYSPFARKNDLTTVQVYEKGKHLFVSCNGNKTFGYLQFNTMGGVSTTYNCNIDTEPTDRQINFLGKPIKYTKFFESEQHRY